MARANGARAKTWLPRWAWMPTNSTAPAASRSTRRSTARRAAPEPNPNPNLESSCPVWTYSWVCTSIPGVIRASTLGRGAPDRSPGPAAGTGLRFLDEQPLEAVDLVERVHHDAADTEGDGGGQFLVRLVVAMEHEAVGRHAGRPGRRGALRPSTRRGTSPPRGQSGHGRAEEGLGGIGHPVAPGLDRLAAVGPEVGLVVDEQRGAVLLGQVDHVDPTDPEPTGRRPISAVRGSSPGSTGSDGRSKPDAPLP